MVTVRLKSDLLKEGGTPRRWMGSVDPAYVPARVSVIRTTSGRQRSRTGGVTVPTPRRDEDPGSRALHEAVEIFLAVVRGDDRGPVAGDDHLAAVGVAAEHQADAAVVERLGEVGVVREQDHRVAIGRVAERRGEVLPSVQRSPTPPIRSRAPPRLDPVAGVDQVRRCPPRPGPCDARVGAPPSGRGCPARRTGPSGARSLPRSSMPGAMYCGAVWTVIPPEGDDVGPEARWSSRRRWRR